DEIELYFHPELQRTYLSFLIDSIKKVYLSHITSINICFITHSPFILSDIPSINILFLDEGLPSKIQGSIKTFGANIHQLLIDGFFMANTLGELAVLEAKSIIKFHSEVMEADQDQRIKLKAQYQQLKSRFAFVCENLGEEYLKGVIENHVDKIEELLGD